MGAGKRGSARCAEPTESVPAATNGARWDKGLLIEGLAILGVSLAYAACFDAALYARLGFNDNWPVGFICSSPFIVLGSAFTVAFACGARRGSRAIAAIAAVISLAPALVGLCGLLQAVAWPPLAAFGLACFAVAALALWRPRLWPLVVAVSLVPFMLATAAVFYGNLTYSYDKSRAYTVETYDELKLELSGCEGIGFPDLSEYADAPGMTYKVLCRRDLWAGSGDSYWLASAEDGGLPEAVALVGGCGDGCALAYVSVECRDTRRDYGFGFPMKAIEENTDVGGVGAELSQREEALGDGWRGRSLRGFAEGDVYGSCSLLLDASGYQYEIAVEYGVHAGEPAEIAASARAAAEREARRLALSIINP